MILVVILNFFFFCWLVFGFILIGIDSGFIFLFVLVVVFSSGNDGDLLLKFKGDGISRICVIFGFEIVVEVFFLGSDVYDFDGILELNIFS